jgi:hypothetical protein
LFFNYPKNNFDEWGAIQIVASLPLHYKFPALAGADSENFYSFADNSQLLT